jgi:hypothetical protein
MMRADIFTGLCISEAGMFIKNFDDSRALKMATMKYFEQEAYERNKDTFLKLKGWNYILHHKCNQN